MGGGASEVDVGVREGDILAGKYRIDKILGAGGMGVVVAAHHIRLDEKVAIKFLLPDALGSGEALGRFEREARAAVKIKSEHVARVTDVGTLENGAPYILMEYLEGGDLAAWVQQRGALPIEQAVEFVLQACEAIAEAHGLGIVHRDLKPANLFIIRRPDGGLSAKVLDFGISKVTAAAQSVSDVAMTKTRAVMGSPLYMSPEQLQSAREVDARSDIWALGIILYELLAGQVPFHGETFPDLCVKIATQTPPPLRSRRPDAPEGLERAVMKCLEKDRSNRYRNVAELAVALAPFAPKRARVSVERISGIIQAAGLSASALALPPSSDPTDQATGGTVGAWGNTARPWRKSPMVVIGIACAASAVVVAAFVLRARPSSPAADVQAEVVQNAVKIESPAPAATMPVVADPPAPAAAAPSTPQPASSVAPEPVPAASQAASAAAHAPVAPKKGGQAKPPQIAAAAPAAPPAAAPAAPPAAAPAAPPIPPPAAGKKWGSRL
jgi:eukaryotic-like serine/threonine-protein kinase